MDERSFRCSNCGTERPEDSWGRTDAVVLIDDREQIPVTLAVWCNEECLATWIANEVLKVFHNELKRRICNAQVEQ